MIVSLIENTINGTGLRIKAKLGMKRYPKGIKVTDEEFSAINIDKNKSHGKWNYADAINCSSYFLVLPKRKRVLLSIQGPLVIVKG